MARSSRGSCPGQVALVEGQKTRPPQGHHKAPRGRNRLGHPEPLWAQATTLSERAQCGMACGQGGPGGYGGQVDLPEALATAGRVGHVRPA